MKLTKKEEALILANRAKESDRLPKKFGYLKEDLYVYDSTGLTYTAKEKDVLIKEFVNKFELCFPAGTQFDCYIEENGDESWYDSINGGLAELDVFWAKQHIKNIKTYKKK